MRSRFSSSILLFLLLFSAPTFAQTRLETLATKAVSTDTSEAAKAIAELRALGPAGLNALRQSYSAEIAKQIANPLLPEKEEWQRIKTALDAVSQQKDSYLGGLYWYTDLNQAKAVARASGKPILSLRLLGKLSEEFSCANSRFFRTVLYANADVSKKLREDFVLHWQSVRPAPRVTIDFGDGRKLERTLTGNSIHYILDTAGQPIEALPGLYGPKAFMRLLGEAQALLAETAKYDKVNAATLLRIHHQKSVSTVNLAWASDTQKIGGTLPPDIAVQRGKDGKPEALWIASLAVTKAYSETTILRGMTKGSELLGGITDEAAWRKIAQLHIADAELDAQSIGLIKRQTQKVLSSRNAEKELATLIRKLQMNIALDTVRNEYVLHSKLHAWLVTDARRTDLDAFNNKVYAELFLTPATDPWLGLFSSETYVALENGGLGS